MGKQKSIKTYYFYHYQPNAFSYIDSLEKIYYKIKVIGNACYIKYVTPGFFSRFFRYKLYIGDFYQTHNILYVVDSGISYQVNGPRLIPLDEMFFIRKKFDRKFKKILD